MTDVRFEAPGVVVFSGDGAKPASLWLAGARARVDARITGRGKTWTARLPLEAARWGGPLLPLPSGEYDVRIQQESTSDAEPLEGSLAATTFPGLRASLENSTVQISAPTSVEYASGEGQAALERRYVHQRGTELENAVFFESFYGRSASCNPLAIDRELQRVAPGVTRYWSVVDLSVEVPTGAVAVIEGSPQWWRARASARLLVVNDWLRRIYHRRPGQRVLQTWHGTPLKRLALHRPGFDPRRMAAVVKESLRWDFLLAQNPYAARILRKAYAFLRRPVWVEGYPRNDVLVNGDGSAVREALGVGPDERVVLYAPTWRDDREEIVDFFDPAALAAALDAVVLVRGHSRTLIPGRDARGPRVIDVTGFPDISQLLLAADSLVTDYSSVMFDFTVTGKPVYFLVPDIDHYRGELRGFYFDLEERAPGPVVRTLEALVEAMTDDTVVERFHERYATWRSVFNARDDGHAAERVVARILDQGLLSR